MSDATAVLDVGKTHTRLSLVGEDGAILANRARVNAVHGTGAMRTLDTEAIEAWLAETLRTLPREARIAAIVPVAHGAAAAYVRDDELALPVLDYESEPPDEIVRAYRAMRDPFARTLSPLLPQCLNLGLQLYWQEETHQELRAASTRILPWPQFWAWRLSGVCASEVTSLGCHSDVWFPAERGFSSLATARGWDARFAPLSDASAVLGRVRPELARQTGIAADCEIHCGLHDSNAALLAARGNRKGEFALVSTGTWFVAFASGGVRLALDPQRDTLANVDVEGNSVPSARFMGGREYEAIAGDAAAAPSLEAAAQLAARGVATKPAFVAGSGPFARSRGSILGEANGACERASLASLHLALMTQTCLKLIAAQGPVVLEGRFAAEPVFTRALASLRAPGEVHVAAHGDGVALGAARLRWPQLAMRTRKVAPLPFAFRAYADAWFARANAG